MFKERPFPVNFKQTLYRYVQFLIVKNLMNNEQQVLLIFELYKPTLTLCNFVTYKF
jgi:hypothetical protein